MTCIDPEILIDDGVNRILTQYRESPNLLFLLRTFLGKAAEVSTAICALPEYFDIETAVGDQLTLIGKRMGFPRCHCVCNVTPVAGFECDAVVSDYPLVGFCDGGTWADCGPGGISEICIDDDDLYRRFLKARRYQMLRRYSIDDLTLALQELYGPTARVLDAGHGRVVLAPFRDLTQIETDLMQVVPRVLPIALGIRTRFHFGVFPVAGFGDGWAGFCEELLGDPVFAIERGPFLWTEIGDFLSAGGPVFATEDDDVIWTENGDYLAVTASFVRDGDWMCEIDVKPYSC